MIPKYTDSSIGIDIAWYIINNCLCVDTILNNCKDAISFSLIERLVILVASIQNGCSSYKYI